MFDAYCSPSLLYTSAAPAQVYYPTQQQQPTMVAAVQQQPPQQQQQQVPQQQQQPQQQPQQQQPQQPQQQQAPQQQQRPMSTGGGGPYQKREKRGLAIVDPNTGRDITEDLRQDSSSKSITPPPSESSSERATPRPVRVLYCLTLYKWHCYKRSMYSSTCRERTPSGPGKSVRT